MYIALELDKKVKEELFAQWKEKAEKFHDADKKDIANNDTQRALDNVSYTHAVQNTQNGEYVALTGIIEATRINLHKVLDLKLNPAVNPDYRDEQHVDISLFAVSADLAGMILALLTKGIIEQGMNTVKIFGRGHDMKTFFKLVVERLDKKPIEGFNVYTQANWLVIDRI